MPTAPSSELRISGRRVMPDSSAPRLSTRSVSARSSSEERAGCRISTISWSPISLRAHWISPMPINSSAKPSDAPRATLEAPSPKTVSTFSPSAPPLTSKAK